MKKFKDHILQITQTKDRDYYKSLTDEEKKSFNSFLILKYLSYSFELLPIISKHLDKIESLPPDTLYRILIEIIPKGEYQFKFIKSKKGKVYLKNEVELISKHYQCSTTQSKEYIDILKEIGEYRSMIKTLRDMYGK